MKETIRDPYDAFVCRAWKAAQLTGAEQYILLGIDEGSTPPQWATPSPCFTLSAAAIPSKAPFSILSGSFCDLGTLPIDLNQDAFSTVLRTLIPLIPTGSTLVFQYSSDSYSYRDMEKLLSSFGCLIYEHLDKEDILEQFTVELALCRPRRNIRSRCYCLAVKYRNIH